MIMYDIFEIEDYWSFLFDIIWYCTFIMKLRKSQLKNVVHEDHIYLDRHFFSKEGKDVHQK